MVCINKVCFEIFYFGGKNEDKYMIIFIEFID